MKFDVRVLVENMKQFSRTKLLINMIMTEYSQNCVLFVFKMNQKMLEEKWSIVGGLQNWYVRNENQN